MFQNRCGDEDGGCSSSSMGWRVVVLVAGPGAIAVVAVTAWGGCGDVQGCLVIIFK